MSKGILEAVRVVDMTTGLAGPMAAQLLAEQGADVVKVEPRRGDFVRDSPAFATWNRSKKGLSLELNDPVDRERLYDLLADADVLLHGLRPSKAEELGLDDASAGVRWPGLIVSSVPGYPSNHRDRERSGHDILVQARSGMMSEDECLRAGPIFYRLAMPSWSAVFLTATAIAARLLTRRQGLGVSPVHTSVYQGALAILTPFWYRAAAPSDALAAKYPTPIHRPLPGVCIFSCADGIWIHALLGFVEHPLVIETLAEMGEEFFEVEGLNLEPEHVAVYQRMFERRPSTEWLAAFGAGDVPAARIAEIGEVFHDPQAVENGYVVETTDPTWGRVLQAGSPIHTHPPAEIRSPAPALGEHNHVRPLWTSTRDASGAAARAGTPGRPLDGVRVLDFGSFIAGPFGAMLLAELGADVIKIESVAGDNSRRLEGIFVGSQRGKRSLAIDLTDARVRPVLHCLVEGADVVHHNMRLPAARRLGIDYDSLITVNPRLIYSHVSAYGPAGIKSDWPGYDPIAHAQSGWASAAVPPGAKPMWYRLSAMDLLTPMASVLATVLALYQRLETRKGSLVTTSMLGIATLTNSETMLLGDDRGLAPFPLIDADQTGVHPGYRIYRVADGRWIAVVALTSNDMDSLMTVAGVTDPFAVADAISSRAADELIEALTRRGVAVEAVLTDHEQEFFDDAGGLAVASEHRTYGGLEQPGNYWDFPGAGEAVLGPPPVLGQHTGEVLAELGLTRAGIDDLADAGLIAGDLSAASFTTTS